MLIAKNDQEDDELGDHRISQVCVTPNIMTAG